MEIKGTVQTLTIEQVVANKYNPKVDYKESDKGKKFFEKLKKSLGQGQVEPLLVREVTGEGDFVTYELINGYHRLEAMREMGFAKVLVNNLGAMSENEAIGYALSTEEIKWDIDKIELANLLKRKQDEDELQNMLDLLPYTEEEIQEKLDYLSFDWTDFEGEELSDEDRMEEKVNMEQVEQIILEFKADEKELFDRVVNLIVVKNQGITQEEAILMVLSNYEVNEGEKKDGVEI